MSKLAKDLKYGDVILIVADESTPQFRAFVTHSIMSNCETDRYKICFLNIDAEQAAPSQQFFWTDADDEFDTVRLLSVADDEAAYRIGYHAFEAGWEAAVRWSNGTVGGVTPPGRSSAWESYYPPEELQGIL